MLTAEHHEVLLGLGQLEVGPQDVALTFTARLARDNGWTLSFAKRVVTEYKRFLFLAKFAGHPVTPSDQVDQAWHLHLVYTESYWKDLCDEVLHMELHHGPTKGGKREGEKFVDWYEKTLQSYRRLFGESAPADIWPDSESRFRNVSQFRRVNAAECFIIPKRMLAAGTMIVAGLLPLLGCMGGTAFENPLTEYGAFDFLMLYAGLVIPVALIRIFNGRSLALTRYGLAVSAFGIWRIAIGIQRMRPVGYLVMMVLGTLIFTLLDNSGRGSSSGDGAGGGGCGGSGCGGGGCGGCGS